MTEQANSPNLMLRNDTVLGVCEAIGQDLGINPTWLRVAFCLPIFLNPLLTIGAYLGLGLVVAATRYAFPDRRAEAPAAPAQLVEIEATASEIVEERELIAA